jgi:hypothetical protein
VQIIKEYWRKQGIEKIKFKECMLPSSSETSHLPSERFRYAEL